VERDGEAPKTDYIDPYANQTHNERRNPTTAITTSVEDRKSPLVHAGLDPSDKRVRALAEIVGGLHQIPRHRSIHVGGFVLTAEPLSTVVPIEPASMPDRTVIQWEKDDLDPVGLVKIDLLGLGMLTLIQDCLLYVRHTRGTTVDLAQLDMDDQAVYDDLCAADTIGVFQVESRAQMNTLPRLKPRCFYDLVVEVAIIRPGPIQGDMVHPYLRRRAGEERVEYPHPSLQPILKRTLGVPLFQEQGMQVAIACAGFSAGEADMLRRAMGHKRSRERMAAICAKLIDGMKANGIAEETAIRIYNQINAFADYGFPESHAASFALLVYASAYLKHYYAPEFTAAILNAQPMGFYAPGTLIEDARRHGVKVLPVDVRWSRWDATLELMEPSTAPAVRLGVRSVRGLGSKAKEIFEAALADGSFESIDHFVRRTRFDQRTLRQLAEAGAFDGFVPDEPDLRKRRAALWEVLDTLRGDAGPLAPRRRTSPGSASRAAALPKMSPGELTEADYRMTGISLNGHPMSHLRPLLQPNGIRTARQLVTEGKDGEKIAGAGLVICRQRPGTAKGFVFLTLEDETGTVNVVVTPKRFERQALLISTTPLLLVRGTLQVEQGVVNIRGAEFRGLNAEVGAEFAGSHDFH
jgi:error-prone DNA polymerase